MDYFRDVVGQKAAVEHLQNALRTGEISHAYIFKGEKGTGRMRLARAFGAALLCENRHRENGLSEDSREGNGLSEDRREENRLIEPCGACHSCVQVEADDNPDLITVRHNPAYKSKNDQLVIGDIRDMRADVQIRPYSAKWKVYIVPDAQLLNRESQNALLKTLEEPPAYAVLILLADGVENFLPTVLSRCIILPLYAVDEKIIAQYLEQSGVTPKDALLYAKLSHGSAGRAQELATDENARERIQSIWVFLKKIQSVTTYDILQLCTKLSEDKKFGTVFVIGLLQDWLRDLLLTKSAADPAKAADSLIFADEVQYIRDTSEKLSFKGLESIRSALELALLRLHANGNEMQVMEMALLSIRSVFYTEGYANGE